MEGGNEIRFHTSGGEPERPGSGELVSSPWPGRELGALIDQCHGDDRA